MRRQVQLQELLQQDSVDGEHAIHLLVEWRVKQAATLRQHLRQLRELMEAAGELLRDEAAPPSAHSHS